MIEIKSKEVQLMKENQKLKKDISIMCFNCDEVKGLKAKQDRLDDEYEQKLKKLEKKIEDLKEFKEFVYFLYLPKLQTDKIKEIIRLKKIK